MENTRSGDGKRTTPSLWRKLCIASALLCVLFAVMELALRWLLFSATPFAVESSRTLRRPANFASSKEEAYWQLQARFDRDTEALDRSPAAHPHLGWSHPEIDPLTYDHRDHAELAGRRPVLVFGDSFSRCFSSKMPCWQQFLEETPFAQDYRILNYGVNAYGFDQSVALMLAALERYREENPIVVLGVLADDDLDRSGLLLRDWPRGHFELAEAGGLDFVAPETLSRQEHLARHPLRIKSYLWRYLFFGKGLLREAWRERCFGWPAIVEQRKELQRRLLKLALSELQLRGLEHFCLIFHEQASLERGYGARWQEPFLVEELERYGTPYLLSRPHLLSAASRARVPVQSYYLTQEFGYGHLNEAGNRVLFAEFLRALAGSFHQAAELRLAHIDAQSVGPNSDLQFESRGPLSGDPEENALVFTLGAGARTRLTYDLLPPASRLTGHLRLDSALAAGSQECAVHFAITLDERTLCEVQLSNAETAQAVDLSLESAQHLRFSAEHLCQEHDQAVLRFRQPCVAAHDSVQEN